MQLLTATNDVLSELTNFLEQVEEAKYRQTVAALSNSTIGQHTRHTLEFFQCLVSQREKGVINYDKRSRNQLMEEHPSVALETVAQLPQAFEKAATDLPVLLETTFSEREDDYSLIPSSFHREWSYALEHAIHHMAIIKIGLKMIAPEVKVPDNFGVGPATVKYRQRQCAQ
jgi:hypothetical protein